MMKIMNTGTVNIKSGYLVDKRCVNCFQKGYQRLFEKFKVNDYVQKEFMTFLYSINRTKEHLTAPELQVLLQEKFCELIKVDDPFYEEKKKSNTIALDLYKEWKPRVFASENPFELALRLAIAGNVMDYGAYNSFDVHKIIEKVLNSSFAIDHSKQLKKLIRQAKRILYLGDNAGEIVFDRLFIETIMHNDIIYAVKGYPVLNDVTIEDAEYVGMNLVAQVISNGYKAPSTVLHKCSKEFMEIYNSADLIISKGQGNYEGLMNENDSRIFFLMMVKCDVIAEKLNVEKGSFIVYNHSE